MTTQTDTTHAINLRFYRHAIFLLLFLLFSRLVAMYFIPLNDSTEARYGEIARLMFETGNWITPMHYLGVPFWAKPPLSTWLSASAIAIFGINPFAVRLPALLLSLIVLWLVWHMAKQRYNAMIAMTTVLVLASSLFFFLDAGTVMTDPALVCCTTLIFFAFWNAMVRQQRVWGYVFFIGLGLGLLAKGPIAIALTSLPIFLWLFQQQQWLSLWQRLPWFTGSLLTLAIALPWYLLAEHRTPGFLHYFIMGEHIQRFLQPSWTGDKYGFAHHAPLGSIWLYAMIGIFPWNIVGCIKGYSQRKKILARYRNNTLASNQANDGWLSYLLFCAFIPLIFFTFARNIIYPYVFPSLPIFALLFAEFTHRMQFNFTEQRWFLACAASCGVLFLIATSIFIMHPQWLSKSQDRVVAVYKKQLPTATSSLIYWAPKTDYSALFYSSGIASSTLSQQQLCRWLRTPADHYIVIDFNPSFPSFPQPVLSQLTLIDSIPVLKRQYRIYLAHDISC